MFARFGVCGIIALRLGMPLRW